MQQDEVNPDVQQETQTDDTQVPEAQEPEKDWKAEAAKWQRLAQKAQKPKLPEEKSQPQGFDPDSLIDNFALVKEFAPEELANVRKEAKELGVDTFRFIQSNAGKTYIEKMRSEKQAEDSTLTPSTKGFVFKGKDYKEVLSGDDEAAKQAAFEARLKGVKR